MKDFKLRNGKFPPLKVILLGASNFQFFFLFFFLFFFWKNLTNPPFFIDGENYKVNRCHPYEADEKKNFILSWDEGETNGQRAYLMDMYTIKERQTCDHF